MLCWHPIDPWIEWVSFPSSETIRSGYQFCLVLILDAELLSEVKGSGTSNTESQTQVFLRKGNNEITVYHFWNAELRKKKNCPAFLPTKKPLFATVRVKTEKIILQFYPHHLTWHFKHDNIKTRHNFSLPAVKFFYFFYFQAKGLKQLSKALLSVGFHQN